MVTLSPDTTRPVLQGLSRSRVMPETPWSARQSQRLSPTTWLEKIFTIVSACACVSSGLLAPPTRAKTS
jgi:hypothetical protein